MESLLQMMMQQMLGNQQGAMSNAVDNSSNVQNLGMGAFNPYNAPWQSAGAYSNAVGGPTVLGSGASAASSKGGGGNASIGGK
jgi:hypothetical protein